MSYPLKIISAPHHDNVPGRGRYVVATRKIEKGQLAFRTSDFLDSDMDRKSFYNPYTFVIGEEYVDKICWQCFGKVETRQWKAVGKRWFCSQECRELGKRDDELGEIFEKLHQVVARERRNAHKRQQREEKEKRRPPSPVQELEAKIKAVSLEDQLEDEDLPLDFLEQSNWEPPRQQVVPPPSDLSKNKESPDFNLNPTLTDFEKEMIEAGLNMFDNPTPEIARDLALDDVEVDICRYIIQALWKRLQEEDVYDLDNPKQVALPDLANPCVPTFGHLMQLQHCENVYQMVTLRRRNALNMSIVLEAQAYNLAKGVRNPKYPTTTTPFYITPELERHLKIYHLLRQVGIDDLLGPDSKLFRSVLYRDLANCFGIWEYYTDKETNKVNESVMLGSAMYPLASFFNHSCDPNLERSQNGRTLEFYALRDIEEGEEVNIAYGEVLPKVEERRLHLRTHYYFDCGCRLCSQPVQPN